MKINLLTDVIRPMIEIEFNNSKYPALIDSGAEGNMIYLTKEELENHVTNNILESADFPVDTEGVTTEVIETEVYKIKHFKIGDILYENIYAQAYIADDSFEYLNGKFIIGYPILKNYNYTIYNDKRVVEFIPIDEPYNFRDLKTSKIYKTLTEIIEQSDDDLLIRNLTKGCDLHIQKELIQVLDNFIIMHHMENEPDKYLKVYNKLMHIEE